MTDAGPDMAVARDEIPLTIRRGEATMIGVLHAGADAAERGVVIVVGGPQVRAGSHRQFVLLARRWAAAGVPVLRFDCRGKGDSGGEFIDFEHLDDDIAAAVDALVARRPAVREVILWGLCDGASAILMYAHRDPRVAGVAIVNPWVRTEDGIARATLKHYYARKLVTAAFWNKLLGGGIDPRKALAGLLGMIRSAVGGGDRAAGGDGGSAATAGETAVAPFPDRMARGLELFSGRVLLILSANDLTAKEFLDCLARSRDWRRLIGARRVTRRDLAGADHTFSRRAWRDQVAEWTLDWLGQPAAARVFTR